MSALVDGTLAAFGGLALGIALFAGCVEVVDVHPRPVASDTDSKIHLQDNEQCDISIRCLTTNFLPGTWGDSTP